MILASPLAQITTASPPGVLNVRRYPAPPLASGVGVQVSVAGGDGLGEAGIAAGREEDCDGEGDGDGDVGDALGTAR